MNRNHRFTSTLALIATIAVVLGLLLSAGAVRGQRGGTSGRKPGANAAREVVFLKSIPPRATLAQIRRLLPSGAYLGAMNASENPDINGWVWHIVPIRGTIRGALIFANNRAANLSDSTAKRSLRHRPSDPVHAIDLYLGRSQNISGTARIRAETKQYVDAVAKQLSKPKSRHYDDPDMMDGALTGTCPAGAPFRLSTCFPTVAPMICCPC
jgi:hypothetical protein